MTFDEAMTAVSKGAKVKRASWGQSVALQEHEAVIFSEGGNHRRVRMLCTNRSGYPSEDGRYTTPFAVEADSITATDWEIVS